MLSLLFGFAVGYMVRRTILGLIIVLLYGATLAVGMHTLVSPAVLPLALLGFGISRLIKWRRTKRHTEKTCADIGKSNNRTLSATERENLYVSASIAHGSFLHTLRTELNDHEFIATAVGAIDGTIQAQKLLLSQVDTLAIGSAFALKRMKELDCMQKAGPAEQGDAIGLAMTDDRFERLRAQAGFVAYTLVGASADLKLEPRQTH